MDEGRRTALRQVAVRLGQAKFREKLLNAYDFKCAITGTKLVGTLQAAHIVPHHKGKGADTNSVQNGLLLRADIHNLFDLGLIQIDPETHRITVSEEVKASAFRRLEGRKLRRPRSAAHMPSREALQQRRDLFRGTNLGDRRAVDS